jgi:alanine-synthesizing transaminase
MTQPASRAGATLRRPPTMFSSRVPDLTLNALSRVVAQMRAEGRPFTDLTQSNPTTAGIPYPDGLLGPLADARALCYDPQPFGLPGAREAVAADYARRGVTVAPGRVVLTASSSESYSMLFKLFCNPGDAVLVPAPSYPLFEHLAALEHVRLGVYRLEHHGTWSIDLSTVESALDARTRAIIVVAPNNPTGSCVRRGDLEALAALCRVRRLPLIGDEVFADYPIAPAGDAVTSVLGLAGVFGVALGGLSKSAGLPQLKLGWMALDGPDGEVQAALDRLELIGDTYLSVSTPVQVAAAALIRAGADVRARIRDRILLNYAALQHAALAAPSCRVLPVEAGWSAVVRAPATMADEVRALHLLENAGVLVHPGYLFDFDREGYVVISLLPPPVEFQQAAARLFDAIERG